MRPGKPFVYRIPCTGTRPVTFSVDRLPDTLALDPKTGVVTGRAPQEPGDYTLTLRAENAHGTASRPFTLVVGDTLALTPPMGWNSWYLHEAEVTEQDIRRAADAMTASGMADYGYMYVSIDDAWSRKQGVPGRDA